MGEIECPNCGHVWDPGVDPEWAARMRARRKERGIKLREVATRLGFSVAYVSDIERCRRNKPRTSVVRQWEAMLEEEV